MGIFYHPIVCWSGDYLSMLGLKRIYVSKMGPRTQEESVTWNITKWSPAGRDMAIFTGKALSLVYLGSISLSARDIILTSCGGICK